MRRYWSTIVLMKTSELPQDWDERLIHADGSILQSKAWAQFQKSLKRKAVWDEGKEWQWLAFVRESHGLKYLICSYGPTATSEKGYKEALDSLINSADELKVDFVRVEPRFGISADTLKQLGGYKIREVQPENTQIVDLIEQIEELRGHLSSGHRNSINGVERREIKIKSTTDQADFDQFLLMLKDTARNSRVKFFPPEYYRAAWKTLGPSKNAVLYMAKIDGKPIAGALFYDFGNTRYYAHAGAWQLLNRKVNASTPLVWQGLVEAKEQGKSKFDLWGIAPEGVPNHPWAGITSFKQSFGGERVTYVGTWDIPVNKPKYKLYRMYRRLRRIG